MKKLFITIGLLAAVPLTGCASLPIGGATVQTDLKRTRIAADDIYVHAVASGAVLVQKGLLSPEKYRALSESAYQILLKVRVGQSTLGALSAAVIGLEG